MSLVSAGQAAPPFELRGIDGQSYSLEEGLKQGPVLAVFFKVSCPTCQYMLPFVDRLHQRLPGARIWGVSQDDKRASRLFADEFGVTFPILIDEEPWELSDAYRLTHVPAYVLIASNGRVELSGDGFVRRDLLAIQESLVRQFTVKLPPLFGSTENVPEFKPG
jgi:peroxiredoxin